MVRFIAGSFTRGFILRAPLQSCGCHTALQKYLLPHHCHRCIPKVFHMFLDIEGTWYNLHTQILRTQHHSGNGFPNYPTVSQKNLRSSKSSITQELGHTYIPNTLSILRASRFAEGSVTEGSGPTCLTSASVGQIIRGGTCAWVAFATSMFTTLQCHAFVAFISFPTRKALAGLWSNTVTINAFVSTLCWKSSF